MSCADSILEDILQALESWSQRIVDVEINIEKTDELQQNIAHSLQGQVLDGLLSEQDLQELLNVADLWINLYKSLLCYSVGAEYTDRNVLTYLLELFSLKQISKEFFVRVSLQLCRNRD